LKNPPTEAERKAAKAEYDRQYRRDNQEMLKAKKSDYFQRTYDPIAAAEVRAKRMPSHVEYCRRPEYRAWKQRYDKQYRANRLYGPFSEAYLTLMDLQDEIDTRASRTEIYRANGTLNKSLKRKREL
jgi:hypothetical protein